jgi:hypothetical protein
MGRVCKVWSLGICLVCENPSRMPCGIACPGDCACQGVFGGTRTHNRRLRRPLRYHCATKTCLESELAAWPAFVFAAGKKWGSAGRAAGAPPSNPGLANTIKWYEWQDSNLRPLVPKTSALPLSYIRVKFCVRPARHERAPRQARGAQAPRPQRFVVRSGRESGDALPGR